jgi:two-component system NtrC family sensor kinase
LKQLDSGTYYARLAFSIAQNRELYQYMPEASSLLKDIYKLSNQKDSAFKYQEIMLEAKDSLSSQDKVKQMQLLGFSEQLKQQELITEKEAYRNKIKMYGVIAASAIFLLIAIILWRNNLRKQRDKTKIQQAYNDLQATQQQLIQSEKMASLGELTAGIAHEIQNPLNFVNNFSEVNKELLEEMKTEIDKGNFEDAKSLATNIIDNQEKINHHGKRADNIVKGMLQHSRSSTGVKEPTDINTLCEEYLRLAYHGLRAKDKLFNATTKTELDKSISSINIIPQDIGRVILNLINNAFYAVDEKKKSGAEGYEPTVTVSTNKKKGKVEIRVNDNGNGIPQKALDKVFQPFFTTKPTGQGTGLGLSLSYDIVKTHGGELSVETKEGKGSEFIISLPENN